MKNTYLTLLLLSTITYSSYGQTTWGESGSRTDTRDDAGLQGNAGAISGFYQTYNPINFPGAAPSWWHLLDVRHSNPANNYAMQFAGGFFDQNLFFRKTNNNPSQPWSRVLLETDGKVGVGTSSPVYKLNIAQDISMNSDIDVAQLGITGGSDTRKRIIMGYDTNGDGFGYIKAGFYTQRWTNLSLQANGGNVGIGTTSPDDLFDTKGVALFGQLTERLSLGSGSFGFNRRVATGQIFDAGHFAYQMQHTGNSTQGNDYLAFQVYNPNGTSVTPYALAINSTGNVGIGTSAPDARLAVNGTVHAKEVRVDLNVPGADYVFKKTYPLRSLVTVNKYISLNHHLPGVPSAKSMEQNGIDVSKMNMKLLQKVEELTLYLIEKDKSEKEIKNKLKKLETALVKLKTAKP